MQRDVFLSILHRLRENRHPSSGERLGRDSCLADPALQAELIRFADRVERGRTRLLEREEIELLVQELRELEYNPTGEQVARVLTGSRSIADPRLRALTGYKRYRGVITQRSIIRHLQRWPRLFEVPAITEGREPEILEPESTYREIDFFEGSIFDKLDAAKAGELAAEVVALGLRKTTERLPAYMQRARQRLPRAFEPWTRAEKALLIEAMCYTNDAERLAELFGRSADSLRRQGQRLIHDSRSKSAA